MMNADSEKTEKGSDEQMPLRKSQKKAPVTRLKAIMFYVVVGGEIFIPLLFLICLKLYGESRFVMIYIQGLMVVLTTGILVGMIIDLILETFRE
jgi:hypothetical protein